MQPKEAKLFQITCINALKDKNIFSAALPPLVSIEQSFPCPVLKDCSRCPTGTLVRLEEITEDAATISISYRCISI